MLVFAFNFTYMHSINPEFIQFWETGASAERTVFIKLSQVVYALGSRLPAERARLFAHLCFGVKGGKRSRWLYQICV